MPFPVTCWGSIPLTSPGVESYKKNMFALLGKPGFENEKAALEKRLGPLNPVYSV